VVPRYEDEALVLDTHPYRDRDQILAVLTRSHGVIRGVLRRARGGKNPRAAATQLLSTVRISAFRGPHAELFSVAEIELRQSSYPLAKDLSAAASAAVICELLLTYCPPEEPAEKSFRLGVAALDALLGGRDPETVTSWVEYWILVLGGVLPPLDTCSRCGKPLKNRQIAVDPRGFEPLCEQCATPGTESLDTAAMAFLAACRRRPVVEMSPPPPTAQRWLDQLAREHAGRRLMSLEFLRRHGSAP